jgi:hypothetical protein
MTRDDDRHGSEPGRTHALRWLFAPVGGWRTGLLWRLYGAVLNQLCMMLWSFPVSRVGFLDPLPTFAGVHACGLLLLVFGARRALLLATALASLVLTVEVIVDPIYQLAEEYVPLTVLATLGAAFAALCPERRPGEGAASAPSPLDRAQVSLFRVAVIVVMSFAAFHKINADFFEPAVSCAMVIPHRVLAVLPKPEWIVRAMPTLGFLGEASIVPLLLWRPRIGMPFALAVMTLIGQRGATPFTMLVMVSSLAFLRPADGDPIRAVWRRYWPWAAGAAVAASGAWLAVYRVFGHHRPWHEILVFGLVILGIAVTLLGAWSRRSTPAASALARDPEFRADPIPPPTPWVRGVLLALVLAGIANGVAPYLGLKFRMSFAMFSNLRVDEERWNHYLVPRSVFLRDHDPYVHLTQVRVPPAERSRVASGDPRLQPALWTPAGFTELLATLRRDRVHAGVDFRYGGEARSVADAPESPELAAWLAELPPNSRLFQEPLSIGAPQPCLH